MRRSLSSKLSNLPKASLQVLLQAAVVLLLASVGFGQQIISFGVAGSTYVRPTGINATGTICGWFYDSALAVHGFVRDPAGKVTIVDAPDSVSARGEGTYVYGINNPGTIVGYFFTSSGLTRGFTEDATGNFTTFDASATGGTTAYGINDAGQVVGIASLAGFVRNTDGSIMSFIPANALDVASTAINASGEIGGENADLTNHASHGYIRSVAGAITVFDVAGDLQTAGYGTVLTGLNDSGAAGGSWADDSYHCHGFARSPAGVITSFDVAGATRCTAATAINQTGTIAGVWFAEDFVLHGFVRDRFGNITTFDDPNAGTRQNYGTYPVAINRNGQITGYYIGQKGAQYGFLRKAK